MLAIWCMSKDKRSHSRLGWLAGLGLQLVGIARQYQRSGHTHQPTGRLFTQARSNLALIELIRRIAFIP